MNENRGKTFPNEEKGQWEEKCPSCNEGFDKSRGGPQCQSGKCSQLDLQNEHEAVLPPMVIVALPPQYLVVDTEVPKDWHWEETKGLAGLSDGLATPPWIKVPWYTCRIKGVRLKGSFFDTVAHECGHITSFHAKTASGYKWFNSSTRRAVRKWRPKVSKEKSKRDYYNIEMKRTGGGHEEKA